MINSSRTIKNHNKDLFLFSTRDLHHRIKRTTRLVQENSISTTIYIQQIFKSNHQEEEVAPTTIRELLAILFRRKWLRDTKVQEAGDKS